MNVAELRKRCAVRLARADLPRPFDMLEFCARLSGSRRRPVELTPLAMPTDGPSGLWIVGDRADYIVYEKRTTPVHQEHIILHEIGHLLCQHQVIGPPSIEHARRLFPTIDRATVLRMLARTSYSTEEEQEAEMLASLIAQRIDRGRPAPAAAVDPQDADILGRLEATF